MPCTTVNNLAANARHPERYRYRLLTLTDIPETVSALAAWYPGIAVGNVSCHPRESFW